MQLNPFTLHLPKTISEAEKLYSSIENTRLLAGGTFVINSLKSLKKKGLKTPEHIISLKNIPELNQISFKNNILELGAMVKVDDIINDSVIAKEFPVLKTVAEQIATTPIRHMATVGGNLTCRYTWTELPAVMVALNAQFHFGEKENISAEDFFKNAAKTNKILTKISIKKESDAIASYQRATRTNTVDIPMLAISIKTCLKNNKFTETIVAVNNGTSFCQRDNILEKFLNQKECLGHLSLEASEQLTNPVYDAKEDDYKKHIFKICVKRALETIIKNK